ncbi:MAG: tetratricopeptide repeat protein [Bryobacteraceae bacterium]
MASFARKVFLLACLLSPGSAAVPPGLEKYLAGIDAIRQGRYADADASLTAAIGIQPDASFYLARGVARCLNDQPREALDDLQRAKQTLRSREPELWMHATEALSGVIVSAHAFSGGGGPLNYMGIPGHMIQGGADYPTDYASFVYYEMAAPSLRARERGERVSAEETLEAKKQAGAWFANRAAARSDLAPAHLERARAMHAASQFPAVLDTMQFVRAAMPGNAEALFLTGDSWGALGRPASSRKLLTRALTLQPNYAIAYVARAFSAARMGDERRALADLAVIQKMDPAAAGKYRAGIEKAIAANKVTADPQQLYNSLEQAARDGAAIETLVRQATDMHHAAANGRKRYDEWYQDQMRQFDQGIRANPRDPAIAAKAARFVIDEANLRKRGEDVEPRRGIVPYRWQISEVVELQFAIALCEQGLKINPSHTASLMTKALALESLNRPADAEAIVNRVLQLAPRNPEALKMRAEFYVARAGNLYAAAGGLRSPRSETSTHQETRSDGVYDVHVTTYYQPTQGALAQASQLEAQAAALMQRSSAAIQAALAVTRGTVDGLIMQAEVDASNGRGPAARTALEQAIKMSPQSLEANWALTELFRRTGQADLSDQQRGITMNLVQTTGGWSLRQAWKRMVEHNAPAATLALQTARRQDPTDARVAAYSGELALQQGNPREAQAQFRLALAMEEARYRLDALNAAGAVLPREPEEAALLLAMRNVTGQAVLQTDPAAALALLEPAAAWGNRTIRSARGADMYGAMLPDPNAPVIPVPAPDNAATLLVRVITSYGQALKAAGKTTDAQEQFALALSYGRKRGVVMIGTGRRDDSNFANLPSNQSLQIAQTEMARVKLEQRDCQGAADALQSDQGVGPVSRGLEERNALFEQVRNCMDRRNEQPQQQQRKMQIRIPGLPRKNK